MKSLSIKSFLYYITAFLLIAAYLFPANAAASSLDIQGHWAEKIITKWLDTGLAENYSDGSFRPDSPVTRRDFAVLMCRSMDIQPETNITPPIDVLPESRNSDYISTAISHGLITGYPDGSFRPEQTVNRETAAVILTRLNLAETSSAKDSIIYTDIGSVSTWAKDAVSNIAASGIMKGYSDNTFRPERSLTRAEAVALLEKIRELINTTKSSEPSAILTINAAGEYGPVDSTDNVDQIIISAANIILQNTKVTHDLLIDTADSNGEIKLLNTEINGVLTLSSSINKLSLSGCSVSSIQVLGSKTSIETSESIIDRMDIAGNNSQVTLTGAFAKVQLSSPAQLSLRKSTLEQITSAPASGGSWINIDNHSSISNLDCYASTTVLGSGKIKTANIFTDNVLFKIKPSEINNPYNKEFNIDLADIAEETILVNEVQANNTFGGFKFTTDKIIEETAEFTSCFFLGDIEASGFIQRSENDGMHWKAVFNDIKAGKTYHLTCEKPFRCDQEYALKWDANAPLVKNINASAENGSVTVTFDSADGENKRVSEYRVYIMNEKTKFSYALAKITEGLAVETANLDSYSANADYDYRYEPLASGESYVAYVLTVADGTNATKNVLAGPCEAVKLP